MSEPTASAGRSRKAAIVILGLVLVVLAIAALKATYIVFVPLAFSIYLAMAISPIQRGLSAALPPWLGWLGIVAAMLTAVAAVAALVLLFWLAISMMSRSDVAAYVDRFRQYWSSIVGWARSHGVPIRPDVLSSPDGSVMQRVTGLIGSLSEVLAVLALVFFYTLLILIEMRDWQEKLRRAFPDGRSGKTAKALEVMAHRIRRYLVMRTLASLLAAVILGGWLWIIGVDFAFLWSILIFLGNYVPNIGTTLSYIPPSAVAILEFGPGKGALIIGVIIALDQAINSYIVPRWFGRTLRISPLIVLLALIFWTWVWGVAGALLAIPLTVTAAVAFAHVESLKPAAWLLSETAEDEAGRRNP